MLKKIEENQKSSILYVKANLHGLKELFSSFQSRFARFNSITITKRKIIKRKNNAA